MPTAKKRKTTTKPKKTTKWTSPTNSDVTPLLPTELTTLSSGVRLPLLPATFDEVMQIRPLAQGIQKAVNHHISTLISPQAGNIVVQGVGLLANQGGLLVKFSGANGAATLMRDASGKIIPKLVDPSTGRILETARAANGAAMLSKLANISAIAFSIANIVSAHDQVKRLESIEKKLDFLIQARRWDMMAKVEAIYLHAREVLLQPQFGVEERRHLHALCRELQEVRIIWRFELDHQLDSVKAERPSGAWSGFLDFFNRKGREREHVQSVNDAMSVLHSEVHLIDVTVALQTALSFASGHHEVFLVHTLPSECVAWKKTREKLEQKVRTLGDYNGGQQKSSAAEVLERLGSMIDRVDTGKRRAAEAFAPFDELCLNTRQLASPIDIKYLEFSGTTGFLGAPLHDEYDTPDGQGRYRMYENGSIHWHPSTGAHETHGSIRAKWSEMGNERSSLGYPMSDERDFWIHEIPEEKRPGFPLPANSPLGRCSVFQGGTIIWWEKTGTHLDYTAEVFETRFQY